MSSNSPGRALQDIRSRERFRSLMAIQKIYGLLLGSLVAAASVGPHVVRCCLPCVVPSTGFVYIFRRRCWHVFVCEVRGFMSSAHFPACLCQSRVCPLQDQLVRGSLDSKNSYHGQTDAATVCGTSSHSSLETNSPLCSDIRTSKYH